MLESTPKSRRIGIGLMSGSSCDGVDAALTAIEDRETGLRVHLLDFECFPYDTETRARLLSPAMDAREVCSLNFALGALFAEAAACMRERALTLGYQPAFVASHGHTIAHLPPAPGRLGEGTLQIGEAANIAARTGLPVVSDFRPADMAVGGQGAPLVPYADWALFHDLTHTLGCLNIGGIANVSIVTPLLADVRAFDTGPGNMVIDGAIRHFTGEAEDMDRDGASAARGVIHPGLMAALRDHPFFAIPPPRSTGREDFGADFLLARLASAAPGIGMDDALATVTAYVAETIADACQQYAPPLRRLIVSGGGAYNPTLLGRLRECLPHTEIVSSLACGVRPDAREAIAFAILGDARLRGVPANVPGATGASKPAILGKVTAP